MNIHEKLLAIRATCSYLKKDNSGYQFKYVSSSQTLGSLRAAMDEHKVLLIPNVESVEVREGQTAKGAPRLLTILHMSFTWVNGEDVKDQIKCTWVGQGVDDAEKGVGKALTYAEKYFLLKFFNIATDQDDPDSFQKRTGRPSEPAASNNIPTDSFTQKSYSMDFVKGVICDRVKNHTTTEEWMASQEWLKQQPWSPSGNKYFSELYKRWCESIGGNNAAR